VRLATWNVNSVKARLPRLLQWLEITQPDVVCLQETKVADFPAEAVAGLGYATAAHGFGRWNGVAILSRVGLDDITPGFPGEPGFPGPEARALGVTCAGRRIWSVYVPNGRTPADPHYTYKLGWLAELTTAIAAELPTHPQLAICGDFNVAPTDSDVWDPTVFIGATHVTEPERQALAELQKLGLHDVVPRPLKGGNPFTYWDYRAGMFHKDKGMRIDLVYATEPLATLVTDAYVDREARKGTGPSDHAPIVVDLAEPGTA
jgi:exodeoxyribonuclease-3